MGGVKVFFKNKKISTPLALIILDGWGAAPTWGGNAIATAKTPVFDRLLREYPSTTLLASGDAVGLPTNSPGNSEAGHLNIGAGHVVHQDITLIDRIIEDQSFFNNEVLLASIEHAKKNRSNIHLLGLLSDVGIHSHIKHLYTLLEFMKRNNFNRIYIHLFSDGRDSSPMGGIELAENVSNRIKEIGIGQIASLSGRFFSMDRDNRWGRISRAYNLLTKGEGLVYNSVRTAFSSAYAQGQTDEFIEPRLIIEEGKHKELIEDNDSVILFNFRSDRTKELTRAFLQNKFEQMPDRVQLKNLYFATFAMYEEDNLSHHVFHPETIPLPLAKIWSLDGIQQFHCAETEKYPHVTYFINGGQEKPYPGEKRTLIPSPKNVKTYDLKPEMNAKGVTDAVLLAMKSDLFGGFIVNYANADMVGHTGNLEATIKAAECVDACVGKIINQMQKRNGITIVMADHGNAEQMVNPRTGEPDTEHTTNPVPFIVISEDPSIKKIKLRNDGILASVVPTIVDLMNIKKPDEVINQSLIINQGVAPC